MYNNIGGKLKALAKVIGIGGFVLNMFIVLICMANYENFGALSIISFLVIGIICIISSWPLYGFGELINRAISIDEKLNPNQLPEYNSNGTCNIHIIAEKDDKQENEADNRKGNFTDNLIDDDSNYNLESSVKAGDKCQECGIVLTQEMVDANLCYECGNILDKSLLED